MLYVVQYSSTAKYFKEDTVTYQYQSGLVVKNSERVNKIQCFHYVFSAKQNTLFLFLTTSFDNLDIRALKTLFDHYLITRGTPPKKIECISYRIII